MKYSPDGGATSPADEWRARVSPFLLADDPHQRCIARARAADVHSVHQVCDCPAVPCTKPCCAYLTEDS